MGHATTDFFRGRRNEFAGVKTARAQDKALLRQNHGFQVLRG